MKKFLFAILILIIIIIIVATFFINKLLISNTNPNKSLLASQNDNDEVINDNTENYTLIGKSNNSVNNTIKNNIDNEENIVSNNVSNTTNQVSTNMNNVSNSQDYDLEFIAKDKNKASISIKSGTLSVNGATIIIKDLNVSHFSWVDGFRIEILNDTTWEKLIDSQGNENTQAAQNADESESTQSQNIEEELETNSNQNNFDENNELEENISWQNIYGTLGVGHYRIVKSVNYNGENIDYYAEFIIN